MTYRTSEDFAREGREWWRLLRGMIRRVAVTLTSSVRWQVLGQRGGQGGDETWDVEPFTGIGFYSRPPSSGNPEAVVVAFGGAKSTAIVATRDEATRKTGAGDLDEDETCVFNSQARVIVKKDGTVEIRLHGGSAKQLVTMDDYNALKDWIHNTMIIATPSGNSTPGTTAAPPDATGTSVLKGQ